MINTNAFGELIIPASRKTIRKGEFSCREDIKTVYIPDGIHIIPMDAFGGCHSLEKVRFPKDLKAVKEGAFYDCYKLSSLDLPEGLEVIESTAFSKCFELTTLEIPDSVREIGECAFDKCQKLVHVEVGPHTLIGPLAFHECPCENEVPQNRCDSLFDNTKKTLA